MLSKKQRRWTTSKAAQPIASSRFFWNGALTAAVFLSLASNGHGQSQPCSFNDGDVDVQDVIIVGGGPAGTFAAWRIQQSKVASKVLLLEATNRIGGRLYTKQVPGIDYDVADLGGMRYFSDFQPYMRNLLKELKMETKVFEMGDDNENRPLVLRNKFFQHKDLVSVGSGVYGLHEDQKFKSPEDVSRQCFEDVVPKDQRSKSIDQMYTVFGNPLLDYGVVNLFDLHNGSGEAYNYLIDTAGYDPTYSNPNAASMLTNVLSGDGKINILTPVKGMDAIPKQLALNFTMAGGRIKMNTTVTEIDKCSITDGTDVYVLTAYNYASGQNAWYYAKKVVLGLTKSQIQRIHWRALETAKQRDLLESVFSRAASKLVLAFDNPWWRQESLLYLNLTRGRSVSTLPTRQTFYFMSPNPDITNRSFILVYNDGSYANFWSPLASSHFKPFLGSSPSVFPVTETLVQEALRQIAVNHNVAEDVIGRPYFGYFMMWNHEFTPTNVPGYGPYMPSESWHVWLPGYNFTEVSEAVMQLDSDWDVYICGEAYSLQQGWTEGALQTADRVLARFFDISPFVHHTDEGKLTMSFDRIRMTSFWP